MPGASGGGAALLVENLVKEYPGGVVALRGISLEVPRGTVFGLVGPNGAGKSTFFKITATLLKPTSGRVVVDGVDVAEEPLEARKRLVFVPEEVGGYRRLTGLEYIEFVVSAYLGARGASRREIEGVVEEAARLTGLEPRVLESRRMAEYSKGMKRRVQVAWALAVKPPLVLLDEPTSGLDVEASYELRRLIRSYAERHGVTVVMSSHNMLEVQYTCDEVAIIRGGVILERGTPRGLLERYGVENLEEVYMKVAGLGGKEAVAHG